MHSRKLYYTSESYTMQQKVLLYRRKLYCVAESFTVQQKVLLHSKLHSRKVGHVLEKSSSYDKSRG